MMKEVTSLSNDKILENFSTVVIGGGDGSAAQLARATAALILDAQLPFVRLKLVGVLQSGEQRGYLRVSHDRLQHYYIYVGAREIGARYLSISQFLTYQPDFLASLGFGRGLNMLEKENLSVLSTIIHNCLLRAIESLMLSVVQDASQLGDRETKGFLGLSSA